MLKITKLSVTAKTPTKTVNAESEKHILNNINLEVSTGETHIIMGPNGSGKSTLAQVVMGNPELEIKAGNVEFADEIINRKPTTERAKLGIFVSFQNPIEIPGVTVSNYLRTLQTIKTGEKVNVIKFRKEITPLLEKVNLSEEFLSRYVNENFSGGEKKKFEVLQMLILKPKMAIFDEIDSGLDIEALDTVFKEISAMQKETNMTVIYITHYPNILEKVKVDKIHVMKNGGIVKSGEKALAEEVTKNGFNL